MRLLRRILITIGVTLAVAFLIMEWVAPVALSYYGASKAPAVARVVPAELNDHAVSQASGTRLKYVGYEFEVPWTDLDETRTKLYPKDKPTRVVLEFHSGLRLMVTAIPAREMVSWLPAEMKTSPQEMEAIFGPGVMQSDYNLIKALYEFSPEKMHHWIISSDVFARESSLLILKSLAPLKCAESGIFNVQNEAFKGFQQGNAQIREDGVAVNLYSDEGSVEIIFAEKNYGHGALVTQPEINRIIQSLRKAS